MWNLLYQCTTHEESYKKTNSGLELGHQNHSPTVLMLSQKIMELFGALLNLASRKGITWTSVAVHAFPSKACTLLEREDQIRAWMLGQRCGTHL